MKRVFVSSLLFCALSAPAAAQETLGSVTIARAVTADGKALAAGTYQVRLTAQQAQPEATGQSPQLERWVEFVQDGEVKGREVASIVPDGELDEVAESAGPRDGSRVELLKGDEYLRVWINREGNNYLLHLPVGS